METTLERIKRMVETANLQDDSQLISDTMSEQVMPLVIEAVNKQSADINYSITWDRPADEYQDDMYRILWDSCVRNTVLEYLEKEKPQAWFKPMYMSVKQRLDMGLDF